MGKRSYMSCLLEIAYMDMVNEEIERTGEPEKVIKKHMNFIENRLKELSRNGRRRIEHNKNFMKKEVLNNDKR